MPACPKCGTTRYTPGSRWLGCGHHPDEALEKLAPAEKDPEGLDRPFTCRYCSDAFPSAQACQEHQARVHRGVGERLVTDTNP